MKKYVYFLVFIKKIYISLHFYLFSLQERVNYETYRHIQDGFSIAIHDPTHPVLQKEWVECDEAL